MEGRLSDHQSAVSYFFASLQPASPFRVVLQDYYGNQGLAENAGTCEVVYNGTGLTVPELGRVVDISNGSGNFQQFQVQGKLTYY